VKYNLDFGKQKHCISEYLPKCNTFSFRNLAVTSLEAVIMPQGKEEPDS